MLGVIVDYDGKIGFTGIPDVDVSSDDLSLFDRDIKQAFKRLPWDSLGDLLKLADFIIDQGLTVVEETMKKE